jgi:hypothetical protein
MKKHKPKIHHSELESSEPLPVPQSTHDPALETAPGTVTLTAAILDVWPTAQIIQYCNPAAAGVPAWHLWCFPKHDVKKAHNIT